MKIHNSMMIDGLAKIVCADLATEDIDNLLKFNTHNRPINNKRIEVLAESIKSGEWCFNGATIVIDGNGVLRDGQTRLTTHSRLKIPFNNALLVYLAKEDADADAVQKTMDNGQARKYSQQLRLDGIQNCNNVAAIRRSIAHIINGIKDGNRIITDSMLDKVGRDYESEINAFVKLTSSSYAVRFQSPAVAVCCVLAKAHNDIDGLFGWCEKIAKCDGLSEGTTQFSLMRYLMSARGKLGGGKGMEILKSKVRNAIEAHYNGNENLTKLYTKEAK